MFTSREKHTEANAVVNRRIQVLSGHLMSLSKSSPQAIELLTSESCNSNRENHYYRTRDTSPTRVTLTDGSRYDSQTEGHTPTFDIRAMGDILRGPDLTRTDLINMFKIVDIPEVVERKLYNMTKEEARACVTNQAKMILEHSEMKFSNLRSDSINLLYRLGVCGMVNNSLGTKLGVQMGLFGGSILNLGTERHRYIIPKAETMEYSGCFLMTELAHGSNVKGLQTTATYEPETQEFIVHTPDSGAIKWWAGNAAVDGNIGTVFARLITNGKDYGVHAFVVPLRDFKTHEPLPGVHIGDCGDKIGLHGVDNGMVRFDHVRIPRTNLLNRFGDVLPDGNYTSQFSSEGRRFGALLGELVNGRTNLAVGSINYRKMAVTTAVRYAYHRRQFGATSSEEIPILDYRSTSLRLMPIVASCYAAQFANREMLKKFKKMNEQHDQMTGEELAEVHALTAGLKAIHTWDTQRYLQVLREGCGGHGYCAYNRFGEFRDDHDIHQTYEGDNTVLIQQLGGFLMKQFARQFKGNIVADSFTFLRKKMGVWARRRNPIITRVTSTRHLKNSEFQLHAFEYRTAKLLQVCARQFNANKRKLNAFMSWGHVVPMMVNLGKAYVEQYSLTQFVRQLDNIADKNSSLYKALKLTCDVYALSVMEKNIDEFLDLIKKRKLTAISHLLEELCDDMKEHAISLVDSFEIPDFLLDSPIGLAHGNYTENTLRYVLMSQQRSAGTSEQASSIFAPNSQ